MLRVFERQLGDVQFGDVQFGDVHLCIGHIVAHKDFSYTDHCKINTKSFIYFQLSLWTYFCQIILWNIIQTFYRF